MKRVILTTIACLACQPAIAFDWSGFYAGVHTGYGAVDWSGELYSTSFISNPEYGFTLSDNSISGSGFLGGAQIGFNQQSGSFVFGVELDASKTAIAADGAFINDNDTFRWNVESTIDWLATARVRLGYDAGAFMPYVTGGLAIAGASSALAATQISVTPERLSATGSVKENHIGYAVGAGVEIRAADNVTIKAEYLYANLGERDYNWIGTVVNGGAPHTTDSFPSTLTAHTFKVGLNYSFGK